MNLEICSWVFREREGGRGLEGEKGKERSEMKWGRQEGARDVRRKMEDCMKTFLPKIKSLIIISRFNKNQISSLGKYLGFSFILV